MSITLRTMESLDASAISALSHQLGYPATQDDAHRRITDVLEHTDHCAFVAILEEQVVGWIHGFHMINLESDAFVAIAGLVVDENHRRKGIGKMLVEAVADWSVSKKCGRVRVRCNAKRVESHLFYENLGFQEVKVQKIFDLRVDI